MYSAASWQSCYAENWKEGWTLKGYHLEWNGILNDISSVEEVTVDLSEKRVTFRNGLKGCVGKVFQTAGVAIPPAVRFVD